MVKFDEEILAVLQRQDGLITRGQLENAGIAPSSLASAIEMGHLAWVLPRVAGLAGMTLSWHRQARALLLSLGEDSWLSHGAAGHLHGLRACSDALPVDATVRYGRSVRLDGTPWARVHRSRLPIGDDAAIVQGLRTTSVERTLLDLATSGAVGWSLDTLSDAVRRGLTSIGRLRDLVEGRGHVVGRERLRRALVHIDPATSRARSLPELRIRDVLMDAGLPEPVLNHEIRAPGGAVRFEIDVAWPEWLVGFEYDSDEHHSTPSEIRRDRVRHRRIQQLGWDLRHLSSSDLRNPRYLVGEVRSALELSGWRSPSPA